MRVVYLNVNDNFVEIKNIKDDLQVFYDMIDCRCVEMPERRIGNVGTHYFNIICDEEALLKEQPTISAVDNSMQPMLFGNLIICKVNYNTGNLKGLTEKEAEYVMKHIRNVTATNVRTLEKTTRWMLVECEY